MRNKELKIIQVIGVASLYLYFILFIVYRGGSYEKLLFKNSYDSFTYIDNLYRICILVCYIVIIYKFLSKLKLETSSMTRVSFELVKNSILNFMKIAIPVIIVSYILYIPNYTKTIWDQNIFLMCIEGVSNVLGIVDFIGGHWFYDVWSYFSIYLLIGVLSPLVLSVVENKKSIVNWMSLILVICGARYCFEWKVILCLLVSIYILDLTQKKQLINKYGQISIQAKIILFTGIIFLLLVVSTLSDEISLLNTSIVIFIICTWVGIYFITKKIMIIEKIVMWVSPYTLFLLIAMPLIYECYKKYFSFKLAHLIGIGVLLSAAFIFLKRYTNSFLKYVELYLISNKQCLMSAIMLTLLCFVLNFDSNFSYLSNDDLGIQNLLNGNITGAPYPYHQFINVILGKFISGLYSVFQEIQWWYIYSLLLLTMGILLMHYGFAVLCWKKKIKIRHYITLMVVFDFIFYIYNISNIAFTIVPAVFGGGLLICIYTFFVYGQCRKVVIILFSLLGYILIIIHRRDTGLVLLCYILLVYLYLYIRDNMLFNKKIIKFSTVATLFLGVTILCLGVNTKVLEDVNGAEFIEYNKARAQYTDYPHDSWNENPELFMEAGWTYNTYQLVSGWSFIDSRVTTESFSHITNNSLIDLGNDIVYESVIEGIKDQRILSILFISIALTILTVRSVMIGNEKVDKIFLFFNIMGTLALLGYQLVSGRFIYRSVFVVLLPFCIINMLLIFKYFNSVYSKKNTVIMIVLTMSVLSCILTLSNTYNIERNDYKLESAVSISLIEEYVIYNDEDIYFYAPSMLNSINPFSLYIEKKPTNLIPLGGSAYNSDNYVKRLLYNDILAVNGELFKRDDVYFISNSKIDFEMNDNLEKENQEASFVWNLYEYLNEHGSTHFEIVDTISNEYYVYKFIYS